MNSDELFDVIGEVKDEWIMDAKDSSKKAKGAPFFHKKHFRAWAACFVVFFVLAGIIYGNGIPFGGCDTGEYGQTGHAADTDYSNYFGPVFPLTLLEENDSISAERRTNYDFSIYSDEEEVTKGASVTDTYHLHNTSSETVKIQAAYPITGTVTDAFEWPAITVDGAEIEYDIYSGGAIDYSHWRMYKSLFGDNHYLNDTLDSTASYNQKVIVYELSGFLDKKDDYLAETLFFNYKYNPKNTKMMGWGFGKKGNYSDVFGNEYVAFFTRDDMAESEKKTKYFVVIGDDLEGFSITTKENENWTSDSAIKDRSASITRREMELGDAIDMILKEEMKLNRYSVPLAEQIGYDMFYHTVMKEVDSVLQKDTSVSYTSRFTWLSSLFFDQFYGKRVFYLTFEIEMLPGDSVDLTIDHFKEASNSFAYNGEVNEGIDGYEMATTLGTNITFEEQAASISGFESVEIVRQNFGFDIENRITEVELDLEEEYYYIEVRGEENRTVEEVVSNPFYFLFSGYWRLFMGAFLLVVVLILSVKVMDMR